jgi:hypothetical protein
MVITVPSMCECVSNPLCFPCAWRSGRSMPQIDPTRSPNYGAKLWLEEVCRCRVKQLVHTQLSSSTEQKTLKYRVNSCKSEIMAVIHKPSTILATLRAIRPKLTSHRSCILLRFPRAGSGGVDRG